MASLNASDLLDELRAQANPANVSGMERYGINPRGTLGITMPVLRQIARRTGKDHDLAQELWDSGIHEARILAAFIADPLQIDESLLEKWVMDFDSWDVCDQVCNNLFDRSPLAVAKAIEWTTREEIFVRRAGFVTMAGLAVHDKKLPESQFEAFFPLIIGCSEDDRNFVKKAVNWALRQIGKRSLHLNQAAIKVACLLRESKNRSARWIGSDAHRELTGEKVQRKLNR